MHSALVIARVALFALSEIGWWYAVERWSRVDVAYAPILSISFRVVVLFLAGILNLLFPTAILLALGGLVLPLVIILSRGRDKTVGRHSASVSGPALAIAESSPRAIPWCLIWLAACIIGAAFCFKGQLLTHYDNFSHWSVIVEEMLHTDKYPHFASEMISFQSYVPGTATWIWYACRITGITVDALRMLAQAYIMLAALTPIVGGALDTDSVTKRVMGCVAATAGALTLILFNTSPYDLLVDTLLPLVAGSLTLFCVTQLSSPATTDDTVGKVACVALLGAFLALIKTSALLFILFVIVVLLVRRLPARYVLWLIVSVAATLVIWYAHCNYVFLEAATSKHTASAENFASVLQEKTSEDVSQIISAVISFSLGGADLILTVAFALATLPLTLLTNRGGLRSWGTLILALAAVYVLYMIGTLGMFLLSMPMEEARTLNGIDRYRKTIFVYVLYLLFSYALTLGASPRTHLGVSALGVCALIACAACALLPLAGGDPIAQGLATRRSDADRRLLEQTLDEEDARGGSHYALCVPESDVDDEMGYLHWLARYVTWAPTAYALPNADENTLDDVAANGCEWLLLLDPGNQAIDRWVREHYPEQVGRRAIRLTEARDAN